MQKFRKQSYPEGPMNNYTKNQDISVAKIASCFNSSRTYLVGAMAAKHNTIQNHGSGRRAHLVNPQA